MVKWLQKLSIAGGILPFKVALILFFAITVSVSDRVDVSALELPYSVLLDIFGDVHDRNVHSARNEGTGISGPILPLLDFTVSRISVS